MSREIKTKVVDSNPAKVNLDSVQFAENRTKNVCQDYQNLESRVHPAHRRLNTCKTYDLYGAGHSGILPGRCNSRSGSFLSDRLSLADSTATAAARSDNHGGWIENRAASKASGLLLANSLAAVNRAGDSAKGFVW